MKSNYWIFVSCIIGVILAMDQPVFARQLTRSVFSVESMSCSACAAKLYNSLVKLEGFEGMLVNQNERMIAVDHSPSLTIESITAATTAIGKPASPVQLNHPVTTLKFSDKLSGWDVQSDGIIAKLFRIANVIKRKTGFTP